MEKIRMLAFNRSKLGKLDISKETTWLRLPYIMLIVGFSIALIGATGAYHYAHLPRYNDEGLEVLPDPQSACEAARKSALENCREQLEEAWFDDGAHYYTTGQQKRDLPICRTISDAVYGSCISYGQ